MWKNIFLCICIYYRNIAQNCTVNKFFTLNFFCRSRQQQQHPDVKPPSRPSSRQALLQQELLHEQQQNFTRSRSLGGYYQQVWKKTCKINFWLFKFTYNLTSKIPKSHEINLPTATTTITAYKKSTTSTWWTSSRSTSSPSTFTNAGINMITIILKLIWPWLDTVVSPLESVACIYLKISGGPELELAM